MADDEGKRVLWQLAYYVGTALVSLFLRRLERHLT